MMRVVWRRLIGCGGLTLAAAGVMATTRTMAAQQPYSVIDHWKIGGTGGWDYLLADPGAHLIYVTHGPRVGGDRLDHGQGGWSDHGDEGDARHRAGR